MEGEGRMDKWQSVQSEGGSRVLVATGGGEGSGGLPPPVAKPTRRLS